MTSPIFRILRLFDEAGIRYMLNRYREDTIDVHATLVGERIELSIFEDGHVEMSRFVGNEDVLEGDLIYEVVAAYVQENAEWEKRMREPNQEA
ncbi:hypothetical protein [Rhizobium lentis]|uniref:Uncharacterized protein n=1 Tax=Rhizobium lentis TaxID=1138194 RepID=A0A7W9CYW7_9HYPH|nr:hypothetical protein [Rhizobium lentis]MBB4577674.1 hypothetical protein [Rhizobium lentis]MBB5554235.1 hypothetical protein [Rhizobium lentis]MBB5564870.1 hypothetical protein [Rhizobium lentis]MBB5571380.1 hypothetical protein [Rhizobium lentis]